MATPPLAFTLIERTDFLLRIVRCSRKNRALEVEALKEFPIPLATNLTALTDAIAPLVANAEVLCALRPKKRKVHLATAEEANRYRGAHGARQFATARNPEAGSNSWIAVGPSSVGETDLRWIVESSTAEAQNEIIAWLESGGIKPVRWVSAFFAHIGGLCATAQKATWLLDIGEMESSVALVSKGGVRALGTVSLTLDKIAEIIQSELGLKFRGSAAKLFFNEQYDFSEVGPGIANKLAASLGAELTILSAKQDPATALACVGLPGKQRWLVDQLAGKLGLEALSFDMRVLPPDGALSFAHPELSSSLASPWLGCVQLLRAQSPNDAAVARWQVAFAPLGEMAPTTPPAAEPASDNSKASAPTEPVRAPASVAVTPREKSDVVVSRADGVAAEKLPSVAARKAPPLSVIVEDPPAIESLPKATPARSQPNSSVQHPAAPAENESSVYYQPKPKRTPPKPTQTPAVSPATQPLPLSPERPGVSPAALKEPISRPRRSNNKPLIIGVISACVVIGIGVYGYSYVQKEKAEANRILAEKAQIEQRAKAETEKARLAEEKAQEEATRRKEFEIDAMQKLASSEAARQHAESEARNQAAARLANARGTFNITSEPVGATVAIKGQPSQPTPATFADLKIGRYQASISAPHCDTVTVDFEVKEDTTTNLGVVRLTRQVGGLSITSEPSGIDFEIKPASTLLDLNAGRKGETPASYEDMTPGDYIVTFTAEGTRPHTEKVTVERRATASASWTIQTGSIKIVSIPAGATVLQNGTKVGTTPLTLEEQPAGNTTFAITLTGYSPTRVPVRIERGRLVTIERALGPIDRIVTTSELEQMPSPVSCPQPTFGLDQEHGLGSVTLAIIVGRDGKVRKPEVVSGTDRTLIQACLDAVESWKFKPGMIAGQPVNCRVQIPFTFAAR